MYLSQEHAKSCPLYASLKLLPALHKAWEIMSFQYLRSLVYLNRLVTEHFPCQKA